MQPPFLAKDFRFECDVHIKWYLIAFSVVSDTLIEYQKNFMPINSQLVRGVIKKVRKLTISVTSIIRVYSSDGTLFTRDAHEVLLAIVGSLCVRYLLWLCMIISILCFSKLLQAFLDL